MSNMLDYGIFFLFCLVLFWIAAMTVIDNNKIKKEDDNIYDYDWTKEGIEEVLNENKNNLIISFCAAVFLLALAIFAPFYGKYKGIPQTEILLAEGLLFIYIIVGYSFLVVKIKRILKRREKLTKLYKELNEKERKNKG